MSSKFDSLPQGRATWIGLDLAWSRRNNTGACALAAGRGQKVRVLEFADLRSDADVLAFVRTHAAPTCSLGVDAPLVVTNETGMRACDRLLQVRLGKYGAGAYPANRRLMSLAASGPRGEALGEQLAALGFEWPPRLESHAPRQVHEVYPHAAWVRMCNLPRRLAYKRKGDDPLHRSEYARALDLLEGLRTPRVVDFAQVRSVLELGDCRPKEWKQREDRLDALVCALVAWRASRGQCEAFGSEAEGFVWVPHVSVK